MCVYFVAMMCVSRFGLGWAHDVFFLSLHVTCLCIFSCICTFIHLYFDIDLCCWFSVCFFLSLFLSVSCFMAPKWKSTPSQNPFRSEASSSSLADSTPSSIQFHNDKAWKDFLEKFSWRGIHLKCQVILSDFSNTDLPTIIYSRGWESLCGIPVTCPFVIIQEFYSNMHRFDTSIPQFVTRVRGMCIVVTPNIISEVLHVPRVAHPDYPGCDHLRTVSKDKLSSLFCEKPSS